MDFYEGGSSTCPLSHQVEGLVPPKAKEML